MLKIKTTFQNKKNLGASLVEYGLLVALIAVVALPSVRETGWKTACNMAIVSPSMSLIQTGSGTWLASFGNCGSWGFYGFPAAGDVIDYYRSLCASEDSSSWFADMVKNCM